MAGKEKSPAVQTLDKVERLAALLYRLPELSQGKTESIPVPEDLRAIVLHLLHENPDPHLVFNGSVIYYYSRSGSPYVAVWEKNMVERTEFRKDSIRIQMNPKEFTSHSHYDIIEVVVNPKDRTVELTARGTNEQGDDRDRTRKYEIELDKYGFSATFEEKEEQA
jgi:hypothetical protein